MMPTMLQTLMNTLLRTLLAIGGVLLLLISVVVGTVLAAALVVWALMRGRRPANVRFRWQGGGRPFGGQHGGPSGAPSDTPFGRRPPGEVVDVEVRELPDRPPAELRDR